MAHARPVAKSGTSFGASNSGILGNPSTVRVRILTSAIIILCIMSTGFLYDSVRSSLVHGRYAEFTYFIKDAEFIALHFEDEIEEFRVEAPTRTEKRVAEVMIAHLKETNYIQYFGITAPTVLKVTFSGHDYIVTNGLDDEETHRIFEALVRNNFPLHRDQMPVDPTHHADHEFTALDREFFGITLPLAGSDWSLTLIQEAISETAGLSDALINSALSAFTIFVMGIWGAVYLSFYVARRLELANDSVERSFNAIAQNNEDLERLVGERTRALEESQQAFRLHLENTPLGVITWDKQLRCRSWNSAAARIFGFSEAEALNKSALDLIVAPEKRSQTEKYFANLLAGVAQGHSTETNITKNRHPIICEWFDTLLKDGAGKIIGVASIVQDITERKTIERELQISQHRHEQLITSTSEGYWFISPDGKSLDANPALCRILDRSREDVIAGTIFDFVDEENAAIFERELEKRKQGGSERYEIALQRSDGTNVPCINNPTRIHDLDGNLVGSIGLWTDIAELRWTEEALRQREKMLSQAMRAAHLGAFVWDDEEDTCIHCTPELAAIFGQTVEEYLATRGSKENVHTNIHPEDVDDYRAAIAKATTSGGVYSVEAREYIADGTYRYLREIGEQITSRIDGRKVSVGIVQDITETKQAEMELRHAHDTLEVRVAERTRQLQESEERLRNAFDSIPIGIVTANEKGTITSQNPAALRIFGYTEPEIIGENVRILMPDPDRSRHDGYMNDYLTNHVPKIIGSAREVTGLRKDGSTFPFSLGIAELKVRGKAHFIATITDLTDQKQLEEQLRRSQKMEAVGQLVGGIAHDFNNILGIIMGNLDLLGRALDTEKQTNRLNKIVAATERGAALTNRLLSFSRQTPAIGEQVNVNEKLTDLHGLLRSSIVPEIEFDLNLSNSIPNVEISGGEFEDAITNLCINARDAINGPGRITISTTVRDFRHTNPLNQTEIEPGMYVEVSVEDNGRGIEESELDHIFEPFYSTKEVGKGTGLGLSMVYGFVRRSRGGLDALSEPGTGTTIRIFLPVSDVQAADQTDSTSSRTGTTLQTEDHELILVVDDEEDLVELTAAALEENGYRVLRAYSGDEAIEILRATPDVDLVLTDVVMPGKANGYAVADTAKSLSPKTKICLVSGYEAGLTENRSEESPKYPILFKPYTVTQLMDLLRDLLDRS